jgi:protein O-GlcNAc transferase
MATTGACIPYDSCPLCGDKGPQSILPADCSKHPLYAPIIPSTITWCRCPTCAHVFTDGYFTAAVAAVIYAKTNEHQKVGFEIESQRPISARIIEKVLPFVQSGDWLDVGFGNGSLLFAAEEYGFVPVGTDLRADNVSLMKQIGIEAHGVDLTTLDHPGRCSVISMADVLEHMPFPKRGLAAAHALLGARGIVFLSMPNMDSVLWEALSANHANPYWGELEHYHNFGRKRLYRLLDETGFEPVRFGISERYRACMEVVARKKA